MLFPVAAGKAHHPATKGMLLALLALRRLVSHGITDVAEKIVFDGDGGKPKPPTSELDAVDEESDSGTEDDADADDSSGSSGSSSGGARMRSERAARDAAPLVTLPVPDLPVPNVIGDVVPEFSLAALIHAVGYLMIKRAIGNVALIAMVSHIWLAAKISFSKIRSIWSLLYLSEILLGRQRAGSGHSEESA